MLVARRQQVTKAGRGSRLRTAKLTATAALNQCRNVTYRMCSKDGNAATCRCGCEARLRCQRATAAARSCTASAQLGCGCTRTEMLTPISLSKRASKCGRRSSKGGGGCRRAIVWALGQIGKEGGPLRDEERADRLWELAVNWQRPCSGNRPDSDSRHHEPPQLCPGSGAAAQHSPCNRACSRLRPGW